MTQLRLWERKSIVAVSSEDGDLGFFVFPSREGHGDGEFPDDPVHSADVGGDVVRGKDRFRRLPPSNCLVRRNHRYVVHPRRDVHCQYSLLRHCYEKKRFGCDLK